MMTIDIDTISGVPLSGELNRARPNTSVQTTKPSRKMITAAAASNTRTTLAFRCSSTGRPPSKLTAGDRSAAARCVCRTLFDLIANRPLVAELLGFLDRQLEHLRA